MASRTFASFAIRNFRYFFIGGLLSNIGTWIQRIAQDWLVLTQLTAGSSSTLGIVTALQFISIPFLSPYAGAVADRVSKRKLLFITQAAQALVALAMWSVVVTGTVQLWHMYVLATVQGIVQSFDAPARQAFVSEMVGMQYITNAVGLNSMSFNGARLIGPGVAGFLIAAFHDDVAPALLINALTFVAMLVALVAMKPAELFLSPRAERKGAAREGIKYVANHPDIVVLLVVVFMLGTFGLNFQIFNATMATEVFERGSGEYGLLGTIQAVGTLGGALMAARRRVPRLRTILIALAVFSVSMVALALSPSYWTFAVFLIPAGFAALTVLTSANTAIQLSVDPEFRGRVMSIYMAINMGGTPIGAPIIGWVGDIFGPRASILVGAGATGLCVLGVIVYFMLHSGMRLGIERENRMPHLVARWPHDGRWDIDPEQYVCR